MPFCIPSMIGTVKTKIFHKIQTFIINEIIGWLKWKLEQKKNYMRMCSLYQEIIHYFLWYRNTRTKDRRSKKILLGSVKCRITEEIENKKPNYTLGQNERSENRSWLIIFDILILGIESISDKRFILIKFETFICLQVFLLEYLK